MFFEKGVAKNRSISQAKPLEGDGKRSSENNYICKQSTEKQKSKNPKDGEM